jgi:hypothetical protein
MQHSRRQTIVNTKALTGVLLEAGDSSMEFHPSEFGVVISISRATVRVTREDPAWAKARP